MSWSYFIDLQQRTVFVRFFGTVTPREVLEEMTAIKNDPNFSSSLNQLVDASEARPAADFPTDRIRELGASSIFDKNVRRAIIVQGDLAFGLARMFATYREINGEKNLHIFRHREEAFAWVGVSEPVLPKSERNG